MPSIAFVHVADNPRPTITVEVPTLRGSALHYLERLLPHLDGDADTLMLGDLTRRDLRNLHATISNLLPHRTTTDAR